MSLAEYKRKRRFGDTLEPAGEVHKAAKHLEFVVQKHHATQLHYDFRLELDGVLKSWAVPKGPSLNPKDRRLAMMVEDHPYEYRKFEGAIPKGNYGAGNVIIWDRGWYELHREESSWPATLKEGLKKGDLKFILHGEKLKGSFALIRTPRMGENAWLLIKHKDKHASDEDVTKLDKSVVSGRPVDAEDEVDIGLAPKTKMPTKVKPMLATLVDEPFDGDDWLYEIKWDGYRAIGTWDGKKAELYSRNGLDFSQRYKPVEEALRNLTEPAVLDGEVVMTDKTGKSHFELLQNYSRGAKGQLIYYVFDLLWLDGRDLTGSPLIERKKLLQKLVQGNGVIRYSDHIEAQGKQFFRAAQKQGLEGIMAKRKNSTYKLDRRSEEWLKIKVHKRQEVVIGGFTEPKGSRKYIGALLVGIYKAKKLKYVGHVGGGIPPAQLKPLRQQLEKLERNNSPFSEKIKPNSPVHWVDPEILCEVTFSEWTNDDRMRQPIFVALRTDKKPREVTKELAIAKPVSSNTSKSKRHFEFTNLDKVFWPELGYTKGDLLKYYEAISGTMLPYLKNRPHNLLRQPNGYKGKSFFQKDMTDRVPDWVETVTVYSESDEHNLKYYVCNNQEELLYMAQLGCIEINPWNSRVDNLKKPDWAVIDLDPEGIDFDKVVEVAQVVHQLCDELKIPSYPKTSGKTGIHIFIPMQAKYNFDQVRQFSELLANLVHQRTEKITSIERDPKKRQRKIYVDFLQNREGQTLAAPYSARPTKEASVSTPLHWDEVNKRLDPTKFTIKNIEKRLKVVGDLWKPVIGQGIDLAAVVSRME
jgi:bifunctional non-homologous end joining protein LigD